MSKDMGASADGGPGQSGQAPEPASGLGHSATVPSADDLASRLADPGFQRRQCAERLATRIGYLLRMERIKSGYSVPELAERCALSAATIKRIERGEYLGDIGTVAMPFAGLRLKLVMRIEELPAQAIEAGTDETEGLGAERESAVRQDAPK